MLNEWRSNIWIVIELVIVLLVLQLIFGMLYSIYSLRKPVLHADLDDIYVAWIDNLEEDCDGYTPYDSTHSAATDLEMLMTRLRSNPCVEKAGYGTSNSIPYQYNFWGTAVGLPGDEKRTAFVNVRGISPEMLEVMQIGGVRGETPGQLADIMRRGYTLLSEAEMPAADTPRAADFVGKDVEKKQDPPEIRHVGAIAEPMRRSDFEPTFYSTYYEPIGPEDARLIVLRLKPGMGHRFVESTNVADMHAGNMFATDFTSMADLRDMCQMETTQTINGITVCALFVLVMIFLGFLGTFWFRTQQRVPEIAIRKVNGATNRDIYQRFFAEGLILLGVAVVVASPVTVWIVRNLCDLMEMPVFENKLVVPVIYSIVVLGLLIIAGIYAPARRAAAVKPAEALKDM